MLPEAFHALSWFPPADNADSDPEMTLEKVGLHLVV
jgi:hypothetical protein